MAGAISIELRGLSSTMKLPTKIVRAQRAFKLSVGTGLVAEIRSHIRSRSGRLSASWRAASLASGGIALQSKGVEYARASVGGAYLVAKKKRALRTAGGFHVRYVRLNPGAYIGRPTDRKTSYITLALNNFRFVTNAAFAAHFGKLDL